MIRLENVSKSFRLGNETKVIADNINTTFVKGEAVALLGRNGAGKSSLLQMIAGAMQPDHGRIVIDGTVSWPVGFAGSFHNDLTGAQNCLFVARVYGVDTRELMEFVRDFSQLGAHFEQPLRTYSSGMRSRLAFGLSMGIHFDIYLVDEVTAVGDAGFAARSEAVFAERMKTSGAIFVTHSMGMVRRLCSSAAVLENGLLIPYRSVDAAIAHHNRNMQSG